MLARLNQWGWMLFGSLEINFSQNRNQNYFIDDFLPKMSSAKWRLVVSHAFCSRKEISVPCTTYPRCVVNAKAVTISWKSSMYCGRRTAYTRDIHIWTWVSPPFPYKLPGIMLMVWIINYIQVRSGTCLRKIRALTSAYLIARWCLGMRD